MKYPTFDELMTATRKKLLADSDITNFTAGSIAKAIVGVDNDQLSRLYQLLDDAKNQSYLSTAADESLDMIATLFGLDRTTASFSQGEVKFYIDVNSGYTVSDLITMVNDKTSGSVTEIIIPVETVILSADGSIQYTTTEAAVLTDDGVEITVISSVIGSGSVVGGSELVVWENENSDYITIEDFILVTNDTPIDNGANVESDDNFRFRISNWATASAKANETSIRLSALSVPGVSDAIIKNYEYGIGTFAVFVKSTSPIVNQGLLDAVQGVVNEAASAGIRGIAVAPDYIGYQTRIELLFNPAISTANKDLITNQVQENVISYVNNIDTGDSLIINEIKQRVMETSEDIVDMEIVTMGIGPYDKSTGLISVYSEAIPTNQTVANDEKFVTNSTLAYVCY